MRKLAYALMIYAFFMVSIGQLNDNMYVMVHQVVNALAAIFLLIAANHKENNND